MRRTRCTAASAVMMLAATASSVPAQSPPDRVRADVRYLAADAREGRGVGTAGLDSAARYLARVFGSIGLEPGGTDGFLQRFVIDSTAPAAVHSGLGGASVANVIGILPGRGDLARETVVAGAHYDHLGRGGRTSGSLDPDSIGVVHNGADDNASGVAGIVEMARLLQARRDASRRTIVFIAFTAEELGLIGSDYYIKHPIRPLQATTAMLNLDMVGRLRDNRLLVFGTETAQQFTSLLDSIATGHRLTIAGSGDGWGRSDQQSFYAAKIPVLHFFTDTHADYHRTTDDWPKVEVDGIARIAAFGADLLAALATRRTQLAFVDRPQPVQASGGYGAYLGSIPDMSESPGGVRLTGVRSGSPAEQAGLKAGDVITRIGDHEIKDLYAMTDALRAAKPGDTVAIVVLRNGTVVTVTATFGRRN